MDNFSKNFCNRLAFTLLEMSIVLVIIGLLTGGVIAGKTYIRNSQITTTINEGRFYLNAFAQFQTRYGTVAGDMATATTYWTGAHNGNGNGYVYCDGAIAGSCGTPDPSEVFYLFEHLGRAGLINGQFPGTAGPNGNAHGIPGPITVAGTYYPANISAGPISNTGYYIRDIAIGYFWSSGVYGNGYYLHPLFIGTEQTGATNGLPSLGFLRTKEAFQADSKFDDGNGNTGTIRSAPSCISAGTGVYNTTTISTIACILILLPQ